MNATQNIPTDVNGHPISYETNRNVASQARSEFLGEGLVYIYQSIRGIFEKIFAKTENNSRSLFKEV